MFSACVGMSSLAKSQYLWSIKMQKNAIKPCKDGVLQKCATGISGFDEITFGGLPKDRSTLVCGGPGSGKSVFGMEFLARGGELYNEPGLLVAFEETENELIQNMSALGFDIKNLIAKHLLVLEHIKVDKTELEETGAYNLDGLFVRFGLLIDEFKIKRVVLDTIEILFSSFKNELILRAEIQRLFSWFESKEVTVVVTSEKGVNSFSRYGLEEYVADCVILLDNRISEEISTRRLRIVKYRGSMHGCNEYPFIINKDGISIIAITSIKLDYKVSNQRISSGIQQMDTMLDGKGFYRGSSIFISGSAGSGKTSLAAAFVSAACERGEKCFYFSLEESFNQIVRNMGSIGIDLDQWIKKGLLKFHAIDPNSAGLESHLADIQKLTNEFKPNVVVIDPLAHLKTLNPFSTVQGVLSLLIAFFKNKQITTMFTSLVKGEASMEYIRDDAGISSLMDTWTFLQYIYGDGERNRILSVLKSRGMMHSNQLREVILSKKGIHLQDVYIGQGKVLAGSARLVQANKLEIANLNSESEIKEKERELNVACDILQNKINSLQEQLASTQEEASHLASQKEAVYKLISESTVAISKMRMADTVSSKKDDKHE